MLRYVRSSTEGVTDGEEKRPDLSGVYMGSSVKKKKKMSSSKGRNPEAVNGFNQGEEGLVKVGQGSSHVNISQNQHKKKVRRRLHTSRPYQERLLNMAEARREIVTALKFHRASMKQQQQEQLLQQILSHASPESEAKVEVMSPAIYPSDGGPIFSSSGDKIHQSPSFTCDSLYHKLYSNATVPSVPSCQHFSFPLPSQTLGLNLNLQDFSNLSTSAFQANPSLFTSTSSSSSSAALSSPSTEEILISTAEDLRNRGFLESQLNNMGGAGGMSPYPAIDSDAMKEINSMADCHDMVWNDTMNTVTSALKFSKATETSPHQELKDGEDDHLFTELMELPSWLNPTDCYLQQHLNIACPEDSSPDPALPCMDIGEIEGMDGAWLA